MPQARSKCIQHPKAPALVHEIAIHHGHQSNWNEYSARHVAQESRRLEELCRRINSGNLCQRASQVRGANVPCSIGLSPGTLSAMMGGQNCHADVVFADGVVWLARFRLCRPISPPLEVRDYVLRSEAATMEFLQRHTRIPSPRVFYWACESDPANTPHPDGEAAGCAVGLAARNHRAEGQDCAAARRRDARDGETPL